jgi:PAS domain S-box-containing protein
VTALTVRETALAAASNGFYFRDFNGRISYCNEAFCEMWGFAGADSATGTHVSELWADLPAYRKAVAELMSSGSYMGELKARRRGGAVFDAHVRGGVAVDESGKVIRIASILDLSEIKKAQDAAQQSMGRQLEAEKLAATGRMAARIAHDINNPLAGIKNAIHLFSEAIPYNCRERRYVEQTEREVDRIARVVRQLYDLHRPSPEQETDVWVDEVLSDVAMMLEPLRRQHGVRLEIAWPAAKARLHIAAGAIRQIVFSLATNAIEASCCGGVVEMGVAVNDETLVISVSDQGAGIPEELGSRIFEPFFSTKIGRDTEGGLGLGLSTARQIAQGLGATLDYQSEIGRGTVFRLRLPRKKGWESAA